ncbi:Ferredoxin-1 like [Actinidia chinensis var. chinensis]|uniref:Ferredoxin-1 like n=1 Tax=Actinidia chinensis var. chinensis TaxID=1590841 RepID=A0A2R6PID7_ACTCC|nr:Ferredoxin-1 like [Actinidia chinensis var. chinensis]
MAMGRGGAGKQIVIPPPDRLTDATERENPPINLQAPCSLSTPLHQRSPSPNPNCHLSNSLNRRRRTPTSALQTPAEVAGRTGGDPPSVPTHKVTVHDRQRGLVHEFFVSEDQYILHTAESQDIPLPFAFRHEQIVIPPPDRLTDATERENPPINLQAPCSLSTPLHQRSPSPNPNCHLSNSLNRRRRTTTSALQTPTEVAGRTGGDPPSVPTHKVTVHDRQRGLVHEFFVSEDQYILHTAESQDIPLPFAFRHGGCNICAVRTKSGILDSLKR